MVIQFYHRPPVNLGFGGQQAPGGRTRHGRQIYSVEPIQRQGENNQPTGRALLGHFFCGVSIWSQPQSSDYGRKTRNLGQI